MNALSKPYKRHCTKARIADILEIPVEKVKDILKEGRVSAGKFPLIIGHYPFL